MATNETTTYGFRATINRKLPDGSEEPTGAAIELTLNERGDAEAVGLKARQAVNGMLGQEFTCGEVEAGTIIG